MQTLLSIVKQEGDRLPAITKLLFDTKQVFFDEAHIIASSQDKGNQFVQVGNLFPNSHARWGLTATPFLRTKYDNLLLEGVTGGILASVTTDYLINQGYLVKPEVKMIKVPGKLPMSVSYKSSNKAKAEYYRKVQDKGIVNNSWRNQRIAQEIAKGPFPTLILVKTIEQANMIKVYAPNVPLLTGSSTAQQRRDTVKKLQNGVVPALLVTTIWDEGVDIPEIQKVILASGGKSQVKLLQRAGRGLRLAANKHEVIIIDFYDAHNPLLERHSNERKKIWKGECFEVEEIQ
jgi:superfamily II DNA or RNA helicase